MTTKIYELPRPYENAKEIRGERLWALARGAVLVLRPLEGCACEQLVRNIHHIQQRLQYCTIILWLNETADIVASDAMICAAQCGIAGRITEGVIEPTVLRRQITEVSHLPFDIEHRLRIFGYSATAGLFALIHGAVRYARTCRDIESLCAIASIDYSALVCSLKQAGIKKPAALYQIVRLVLVACEFIRHPGATVASIAHEYGYFDDAALRTRLRETFGATASEIRTTLGWEALLGIALRRANMMPRTTKQVVGTPSRPTQIPVLPSPHFSTLLARDRSHPSRGANG